MPPLGVGIAQNNMYNSMRSHGRRICSGYNAVMWLRKISVALCAHEQSAIIKKIKKLCVVRVYLLGSTPCGTCAIFSLWRRDREHRNGVIQTYSRWFWPKNPIFFGGGFLSFLRHLSKSNALIPLIGYSGKFRTGFPTELCGYLSREPIIKRHVYLFIL